MAWRGGLVLLGAVGVLMPVAALVACGKSAADTTSEAQSLVAPALLTLQECEEVRKKADTAAEAAWAQADKSCATVADCVFALRRGVSHDCGGNTISHNGVAKLTTDRAAHVDPLLRQWADGGCDARDPLPIPSCPAFQMACVQGTCVAK